MPRVLVTGAAGFIGSHVSEMLVGAGLDVIGVDNFDSFYSREVKERNLVGLLKAPKTGSGSFRFIEADVARDPMPLERVEAILHMAAKPGVRPSLDDPASYMEANVTATARLFDAARRTGITRIVFASSSSVYGNATPAPFAEREPAIEPISPYAASKRAGELLAHAFAHLYPLRIVCLRFFTVYGPRQRPDLAIHKFTDLIARGRPIRMHGDGSSERDYTYITDALDGIRGGLEWTRQAQPGTVETVNLGGGSRVRLDRLIELIAAALGREAQIERFPDQPGDVKLTDADLAHARTVLGFRPRVGIEDGIRRFVRWYEEIHGSQSRAARRAG
jgi:UDP-glucuronate 4-epimerase